MSQQLRASGFGDLVSQSFGLAFGHIAKLLTIYLMFLVPFGIAGLVLSFEIGTADTLLVGFFAFVAAFVWVFPRGAGLLAVTDAFTGNTTSIRRCYGAVFDRPGTLFLLALVIYLLFIVGLVLLVVPGLIVMAMFAVAVDAAVVERLTLAEALGRSRDLTRGQRCSTLLFLLVMALAWGVPLALVDMVIGALAGKASLCAMLIDQLTDVFFFLGLAVGSSRLYLHLRAGEEGFTAAALGEQVESLATPGAGLESTPSP